MFSQSWSSISLLTFLGYWIEFLSMNYLGRVLSNCKFIYNEINAATLTGAIDVVVVEQPDGTYTCSPFHVRFGKIGVLRSKEKVVDIEINGEPVDIHMKLGESGEAFFVEEVVEGEEGEGGFIPPHLATSPIPHEDSFPRPQDLKPWNLEDRLEEGVGRRDDDDEEEDEEREGLPPKTFKAETVEEGCEGVPRTEFRPITATQDPPIHKEHDIILPCGTRDDSADETGSIQVGKRRRRKKSIKKKNSLKRALSNSSSEAAIFQMEDVDPPLLDPPPLNPQEEGTNLIELSSVQECPIVERDIHFFSDTEITPGSSPRDDREFAPVQSDSEFETKRLAGGGGGGEGAQGGAGEDRTQSWKWGQLPSTEPEDSKQESQRWMLQNMLGFMKKTKHMRHKNENEGGIYLSEVNSEDPEMAALYFPTHYRRSIPNSGPQEFQVMGEEEEEEREDAESGNGPSLPQSPHSVEGAVCSPLKQDFDSPTKCYHPGEVGISLCGVESPEGFEEKAVSFEDLASDPSIVSNPKLVVRIDGKVYPWHKAAPIIISLFVFQKPLPQEVVARIDGEMEHPQAEKPKPSRKIYYSSWFNWSRMNQQKLGEEVGVVKAEVLESEQEKIENASEVTEPLDLSNKSVDSDQGVDIKGVQIDNAISHEKYRKTLRLSSQQIAKLKLRPGPNEIEFSVTTAYQGTSRCKCFLFCWRYDDKIVVSDIDGTITKSDVLGHLLPIVGKDWAQSGVAKLFTKIKENGYKLLYLSARAIGQSRVTREYLKSIKQEDLNLPDGPMLLNPTSLLNAFHTEVIEKKPEEFKISCLRDIQALFPQHIKPFYAGYGNKINDVWAYQAVGIPIFRIFTINHKGELKHELTQTFQSTYSSMSGLVDQMFPSSKPLSSEDFSEFVYWREPIAELNSLPDLSSPIKN